LVDVLLLLSREEFAVGSEILKDRVGHWGSGIRQLVLVGTARTRILIAAVAGAMLIGTGSRV